MTSYRGIAMRPTVLTRDFVQDALSTGTKGFHESLTRAYAILEKVKFLLAENTSPKVISEIIALLESGDLEPYAMAEEACRFESQAGRVATEDTDGG